MSRTTVADALVNGLERAGTPRIFLAPSVATGPRLVAAARQRGLPIVDAPGAEAACLMALVTGELAGAPGCAVLAPGHGAADEAAAALAAEAALILLTDAALDASDESARAAVKRSVRIVSEAVIEPFGDALVLAMTEPRGPVQVELSAEILGREASSIVGACRPGPTPAPPGEALDAAAHLLGRAARPVLVVGRGSRRPGALAWLRALAEALPAPVLVTRAAKGALPDPHPLALGVVTSGIAPALAGRADLLVTIGVGAGEIEPSWWPAAPILALGPGRTFAAKPAAGEVVGEVAAILEELGPRLRARERADWDVAALDRLKRQLAPPLASGAPFGPARIVDLAREATVAGTVASVDGGLFHAAALGRWQAVGPLEVLTPPDPTRRGFALPAALAAALCHPARRVLCLADAGTIARQHAELELAARLGLPVTVIAGGPAADDVVAGAEALAIPALRADGPDAFRAALGRALAGARPALVAVPVEAGPV